MARMGRTAGLEGLVVGPYHWNAVTYTGFLRDAYDIVIKAEHLQNIEVEKRKQAELLNENSKNVPKLTNVNQSCDTEVAHLVQKLIEKSDQVLDNQSWTEMMGNEFWDILKLDEFGKDRYKLDNIDKIAILKKKSVVQLLKFIRNKISHIRTCKDEMKEKLKGFFDKDDRNQYQFNENNFFTFWISKFPKLVPYLWVKLYNFKDLLTNYYPVYEIDINKFEGFLLYINELVKELKDALYFDMENGNVIKRFRGPGCSLEFRRFQGSLDKTVFVKVSVNSTGKVLLSVTHLSTIEDKLEYVGDAPGTENYILIFAKNITDDNIWKYCNNCDCKVIV